MYKTVYVDSATLGVQLADSAAEPIRQFYVQYRPTGEEALCQVERADLGLLCINTHLYSSNDSKIKTVKTKNKN